MIKVKRAYDTPNDLDGFRILVDRIWPRGLSKENAAVDLWVKDIAPSTALRKWFKHDPNKWEEFKTRYFEELNDRPELIKTILDKEKEHQTITLVFAAKDEDHNNAVALKAKLQA